MSSGMRLRVAIVPAMVFAVLFSGKESSAQTVNQKVGGWTIQAKSQPHAEVDPLCVLRSPVSASKLYIQVSNALYRRAQGRGNGVLFLYGSESIAGPAKETVRAVIEIDGQVRWRKNLIWTRIDKTRWVIAGIIEEDIDRALQPLTAGKTMVVAVARQSGLENRFSVDLAGSPLAISEYAKCLRKVRIAPD